MNQLERNRVGLVYAGGSILAGINEEGFRVGGELRDLRGLIQTEFPDLQIPLLPKVEIAYTGLSENIEPPELYAISKAVGELIEQPFTKSVVIAHGSDTPEQTGRGLMRDYRKFLEDKGISIFLTWAYNPYPAEDAKKHLRLALEEAAFGNYPPGVYLNTPDKFIPVLTARKQTYHGELMKFYDTSDPIAEKEELDRRMDVFKIANQLTQTLGYDGMFAIIADSLKDDYMRHPFRPEGVRAPIVSATSSPYGKHTVYEFGESNELDQWIKAVVNHALQPELITPFPGYKAFVWPVNRAMEPRRVEMTIQGYFPSVEACILILNHSGTADTIRTDLSIAQDVARMRQMQGIVTFGVTETGEPVNFGDGAYITARDLRDAGVFPLSMDSKVAWAKMYAALDRGLKGPDLAWFVYKNFQQGEFTGPIDKDSVYYAASKYKWRRKLVLD